MGYSRLPIVGFLSNEKGSDGAVFYIALSFEV
jgi:hypothetical protein